MFPAASVSSAARVALHTEALRDNKPDFTCVIINMHSIKMN